MALTPQSHFSVFSSFLGILQRLVLAIIPDLGKPFLYQLQGNIDSRLRILSKQQHAILPVGRVDHVPEHGLANYHLAKKLSGFPGKRLILRCRIAWGWAPCKPWGIDVGQSQDPLSWRTIPRRSADDYGTSIHNLLHHTLEVLLGSSRGGGSRSSLGLFWLCGHFEKSNFHTDMRDEN